MRTGDFIQGKTGDYLVLEKLGKSEVSTHYKVSLDGSFFFLKAFTNTSEYRRHVDGEIDAFRSHLPKNGHSRIIYPVEILPNENIIFPFIEGVNVGAIYNKKKMFSLERVQDIVRQCGDFLTYIHELGLVYLDFKMENLLLQAPNGSSADLIENPNLPDTTLFHVDFGTLRPIGFHAPFEKYIGTPISISPEMICKFPADPRADIYSLSAVLFEMLSGEIPFVASDIDAMFLRVLSEERPHLIDSADVSQDLSDVIRRGMAIYPEERFSSVADFVKAFEQAM